MRKILHTLLTSCKSALFFFSKMHFTPPLQILASWYGNFSFLNPFSPIHFFSCFLFGGFQVPFNVFLSLWTRILWIGPEMPGCVGLLWSISAFMTYVLEWRHSVHILLDFLKSLNFQTHSKQNLGKTRPVFLIFLVMPYYHIDPLICKMLLLVVRYTCACFGTRFIMAKMTNNTSKLDLSVKNMTSFRTAE